MKAAEQKKFESNSKSYKDNINGVRKEKDDYFEGIKKEFDSTHNVLMIELKELDSQYKQELHSINSDTLFQLQSINTSYEDVRNRVTATLKNGINNFNIFVDELLINQFQYNSMR